jgi:hypothetical protein
MERETRLQNFLLYSSPKLPSKWAPPPCSTKGSLWREKLHLQTQLFIHSFISVRVPNKEPSHGKWGKRLVTVHRSPHGWKAYIQLGVAWIPKGIVYDTAVSTPEPCSLQRDKFHLAWVDQSPISQRVVATLIRVYPPQLLLPPTWKVRVWICDTLRYVWGVVFMEGFGRLRVVLCLGLRRMRWREWRKLHVLNDLCCTHSIVQVIKLRTLRWAVHVTHMGERISV